MAKQIKKQGKKSSDKGFFTTGNAARQAGVSSSSLQYYIMIGLIKPTKLTSSGRRLFDREAVEKIALVKELNKSGYPLRAIRDLFLNNHR